MPPKTITYYYRGDVERGRRRRGVFFYAWQRGYSATGPSGGVLCPWMTKQECLADARKQGARARFVEESS